MCLTIASPSPVPPCCLVIDASTGQNGLVQAKQFADAVDVTGIALTTLAMVVAYIWFTFIITRWRIQFRREMNESDTEASTKAVDSLLNYETVKYFNNEAHETRRFDVSMEKYTRAVARMIELVVPKVEISTAAAIQRPPPAKHLSATSAATSLDFAIWSIGST